MAKGENQQFELGKSPEIDSQAAGVVWYKRLGFPRTSLPRSRSPMAYWLFKSEPMSYSFSDLLAEPDQTTGWDGVRNYQARNFLRDRVKVGDGVLYYHSNADPPAIVGIAKVVRAAFPDTTAFDPESHHYDPKSDPASPTWYQVAIQAVRAIEPPLDLPSLGRIAELTGMELLRKGSRLSIQPVSEEHWKTILALAKPKRKR